MSGAQSSSAFAADAPRYGAEPVAAYYQLNQTGAPTPVETLNGLSGQVTVSLNGAPISPSGQNINIVAGTGVLGLTAGGNTSSGTVPLTSTDGSVVFTNPGGTNGAIDFSAIIPSTRLNGTLTNKTGTFQYLILGGAGVSTGARPVVATLSGLTSGKSYLLNIVVNFGIYPGWTPSGVTAPQIQFGWDSTGTNLAPFIAPASLGAAFTFPLNQDYGTLAGAAPAGGSTSFNILTQTVSCIVVAQSTSIQLNVNTSGQTTGPIITVDRFSFMQVVELD
jgi:hypothetical protein